MPEDNSYRDDVEQELGDVEQYIDELEETAHEQKYGAVLDTVYELLDDTEDRTGGELRDIRREIEGIRRSLDAEDIDDIDGPRSFDLFRDEVYSDLEENLSYGEADGGQSGEGEDRPEPDEGEDKPELEDGTPGGETGGPEGEGGSPGGDEKTEGDDGDQPGQDGGDKGGPRGIDRSGDEPPYVAANNFKGDTRFLDGDNIFENTYERHVEEYNAGRPEEEQKPEDYTPVITGDLIGQYGDEDYGGGRTKNEALLDYVLDRVEQDGWVYTVGDAELQWLFEDADDLYKEATEEEFESEDAWWKNIDSALKERFINVAVDMYGDDSERGIKVVESGHTTPQMHGGLNYAFFDEDELDAATPGGIDLPHEVAEYINETFISNVLSNQEVYDAVIDGEGTDEVYEDVFLNVMEEQADVPVGYNPRDAIDLDFADLRDDAHRQVVGQDNARQLGAASNPQFRGDAANINTIPDIYKGHSSLAAVSIDDETGGLSILGWDLDDDELVGPGNIGGGDAGDGGADGRAGGDNGEDAGDSRLNASLNVDWESSPGLQYASDRGNKMYELGNWWDLLHNRTDSNIWRNTSINDLSEKLLTGKDTNLSFNYHVELETEMGLEDLEEALDNYELELEIVPGQEEDAGRFGSSRSRFRPEIGDAQSETVELADILDTAHDLTWKNLEKDGYMFDTPISSEQVFSKFDDLQPGRKYGVRTKIIDEDGDIVGGTYADGKSEDNPERLVNGGRNNTWKTYEVSDPFGDEKSWKEKSIGDLLGGLTGSGSSGDGWSSARAAKGALPWNFPSAAKEKMQS